jgi:hypothetical protein
MGNGGMHGILFYPFEWCILFVIIFEHTDLKKDLTFFHYINSMESKFKCLFCAWIKIATKARKFSKEVFVQVYWDCFSIY